MCGLMTSETEHGRLLTTSWTQLRTGSNGETRWLRYPFVHIDDRLRRGNDDRDDHPILTTHVFLPGPRTSHGFFRGRFVRRIKTIANP